MGKDEESVPTASAGASSSMSPVTILIIVMAINIVNSAERFSVGVLVDNIKVDVHLADVASEPSCLSFVMGDDSHCVKKADDMASSCSLADQECQYNHPHCLSTPQLGFISSTFLIGLMVAAPLFASLDGYVEASRLLFGSLVLWIMAVLLSGLTSSYGWLLTARTFTGAAEAAFYTIVYPYISSIAPQERRGIWVAYLSATTPIGAALGFGVAGQLAAVSWRYVFYLNAALMVPLAALCLMLPSFDRASTEVAEAGPEERSWIASTGHHLMTCLSRPVCMALILGYSMRVFVSGAWSYWGFDFVMHTGLACNRGTVSLLVGVVTAMAGLLGAVTGGLTLDHFRDKREGVDQRAGLVVATRIVTCFALACTPFMFLVPAVPSFGGMLAALFCALYLLFCGDSVVTNAVIWSVPPESETMAMALMNVLSHALGDVTAGPLVGWFQATAAEGGDPDSAESWRTAFYLCGLWNILVICFYLCAIASVWPDAQSSSKMLVPSEEESSLLEGGPTKSSPSES